MAAPSSSSSTVKPVVGILSLGDMGGGIAKLLTASGYEVLTVSSGRSHATKERIKSAKVIDVGNDVALVVRADIILSITPPRDAVTTAKRVAEACNNKSAQTERVRYKNDPDWPLIYVDCNAISPKSVKVVAQVFSEAAENARPGVVRRLSSALSSVATSTPSASSGTSLNGGRGQEETAAGPITIKLMDGGIIGPPPTKVGVSENASTAPEGTAASSSAASSSSSHEQQSRRPTREWKKPSLVLSGPEQLDPALMSVLNMKLISPTIGSASALKACFAALNKGLTALAVLSYTTARSCGVLPELTEHLATYSPSVLALAEKGLTGMPPKAYRWVDEMRQIGETLGLEGGFSSGLGGQATFEGIANLYKFVADETELKHEKTHKRKRGKTGADVAEAVHEAIDLKRRRAAGNEKLELAWRGSWS